MSTDDVISTGDLADEVLLGRLDRGHRLPSAIPKPCVIHRIRMGHAGLRFVGVYLRCKHLIPTLTIEVILWSYTKMMIFVGRGQSHGGFSHTTETIEV